MSDPNVLVLLFPSYINLDNLISGRSPILGMFGIPREKFKEGGWEGTIASIPVGNKHPTIVRGSSLMTCHWEALAKVCEDNGYLLFYERGHRHADNMILVGNNKITDEIAMQAEIDKFKERWHIA